MNLGVAMRNLSKLNEPQELREMRPYWERKVSQVGSEYYKSKYRTPPVKRQLKEETSTKCAYCESKIGHNTPGDVEHKIPVSLQEPLRFDWWNLTLACTECNRRKNDYFDRIKPFLDPYNDDVEARLVHFGIAVLSQIGDTQAEATVRILEIDEVEDRPDLFASKTRVLKSAKNLAERIHGCDDPFLKEILRLEMADMAGPNGEYSMMVASMLHHLPDGWDAP